MAATSWGSGTVPGWQHSSRKLNRSMPDFTIHRSTSRFSRITIPISSLSISNSPGLGLGSEGRVAWKCECHRLIINIFRLTGLVCLINDIVVNETLSMIKLSMKLYQTQVVGVFHKYGKNKIHILILSTSLILIYNKIFLKNRCFIV